MKAYKNIQMFLDYVPNNYQKYDRWIIISKRDFDAPIYMENVLQLIKEEWWRKIDHFGNYFGTK